MPTTTVSISSTLNSSLCSLLYQLYTLTPSFLSFCNSWLGTFPHNDWTIPLRSLGTY
jgi:hypothetical protein